MKKIILILGIAITLVRCAESKQFEIDGKQVTVEPYGWYNEELKNDSVVYKINVDNMFLNIVFSETIVVPLILSGSELYEPISKKH